MELRDYQKNAIEKLYSEIRAGKKAPILRLDCGSGKTVIAAFLAEKMQKQNREMLFLVHRKELYDQTVETFKKHGINSDLIKIGMILTVGRHLNEYNPELIICDECNFALAKTWRKVLDAFPKAIKIGLSATPIRLSGEPMGDIFDSIIEVISATELQKIGYLSNYDYYAPKLDFNIKNIKTTAGDFSAADIENELSQNKIYGDILKYYKQFANNKKTIIYCPTVRYSEKIAELFCANGYAAKHFDANTPKIARKEIVNEFKTGNLKILCNVDLISFGFDVPACDCVCLLRPTQSLALYIQQSSRALRPNENKHAIILDFVGNCYRFGMPTEKRTYSLTGKKLKCDNKLAEPNIYARQCLNCFKVYSGNSPICPYCNFMQPKTERQIKQEKDAELEKIESIKKIQDKQDLKNAGQTLQGLINYAKSHGYKIGWAFYRWRILQKYKSKNS